MSSTFPPWHDNQPYVPPKLFPTYVNHSNITKRGFNNELEILLGFPLTINPIREHHDDLLDPRRNSAWLRHDLALPYYYDTVQYFEVEGEWCSFPVTRIVYRRDRDLLKSEIVDYLQHGTIPARYPKRNSGGVINEPMNDENWKRMVRRFNLYYDFRNVPYLRERSTGSTVQYHYMHFEDNLWTHVIAAHRDATSVASGGAKRLIAEVESRVGKFWYLDIDLRATIACLRILVGPDYRFKFPRPGVGSARDDLLDIFGFDDGDEEVEMDC